MGYPYACKAPLPRNDAGRSGGRGAEALACGLLRPRPHDDMGTTMPPSWDGRKPPGRAVNTWKWRIEFMVKTMIALAAGLGLAASLSRLSRIRRRLRLRKSAAGKNEKEPQWKLAMQAWTYNRVTLFEAIDKAKAVGVKYIEAFPGEKIGGGIDGGIGPDLDAATRQKVLDKLKASGVTLINIGVTGAGDEAGWRKLFEFSKAMGIQTIVSEPGEDQMPLLSKLCDEYKINIAIHDHPKPSHYWSPDIVLAAVNGQSKRIGSCADTGHWCVRVSTRSNA